MQELTIKMGLWFPNLRLNKVSHSKLLNREKFFVHTHQKYFLVCFKSLITAILFFSVDE
jgi:hypothetical protein